MGRTFGDERGEKDGERVTVSDPQAESEDEDCGDRRKGGGKRRRLCCCLSNFPPPLSLPLLSSVFSDGWSVGRSVAVGLSAPPPTSEGPPGRRRCLRSLAASWRGAEGRNIARVEPSVRPRLSAIVEQSTILPHLRCTVGVSWKNGRIMGVGIHFGWTNNLGKLLIEVKALN